MQPQCTTEPLKRCTKCGATLPSTTEFFYRHSIGKDGLSPVCKTCQSETNRAWKRANKERIAETNRAWYEANRERRAERGRAWHEANKERRRAWREANKERRAERGRAYYEANRERVRAYGAANRERIAEYMRAYRAANPEVGRAHVARRRALKRGAKGSHTKADVLRQYDAQGGLCLYCGEDVSTTYHVDHVRPLSRGGSNGPENIVIACAACNISKNNKLYFEWFSGP